MKKKSGHIFLIAALLFAAWLHFPVGAHVKEAIPGVKATCVDTGLTEGKKCMLCGKEMVKQQTIPATGLHIYDDDFDKSCNDCSYVRQTHCSFAFVNHRIVLHDENEKHKDLRVVIYKLGDKEAEHPADEEALKAIDGEAKTHFGMANINKIVLTDAGNYVALLKYNVGDDVEIKVPLAVSVTDDPKLVVDSDNKLTVIDENGANKNHTLTVFYTADTEITDPNDETAVKNAALSTKTYRSISDINKTVITQGGNYVFYLRYDDADGVKQTVIFTEKLTSRPVLRVDGENRVIVSCEDEKITNLGVYVYYFDDQTQMEIYDETALEDWDGEPVAYWDLENIKNAVLSKPGNYVVQLHYDVENGEKKMVALRVTI